MIKELEDLYSEIYHCTACIGVPVCRIQKDPQRVRRQIVPRAMRSEVFLVGQGLGGRTQRRSGLPYCFPDGSLSPTGRRLDDFLERVGYSIDPSSPLRYAYSSDLLQHYPGRSAGGDRRPLKAERDKCAPWLERELALVRPKVVVLLGSLAASDFLERYGIPPLRMSDEAWGRPHRCEVQGRPVIAVPVPHFASRMPRDRRRRFLKRADSVLQSILLDDDVVGDG